MPFTNEITGAGGSLVRNLIKSINYVANSAGWRITKLGDAEFNNITARGTVIVVDANGQEVELSTDALLGAVASFYPAPGPSGYNAGIIAGKVAAGGNAGQLFIQAPSPLNTGVHVPGLNMNSGSSSPAAGATISLFTNDPAGGVFIEGKQACFSTTRYSATTPAGSTTSATYVNYPTPNFTFTKQYTNTKINARLTTVPFLTGAGNTTPFFGIQNQATANNYDLGGWQIGAVSTAMSQSFETTFGADIAAGTLTLSLMWKRTAGTGTLNAGGWTSLVLEEVP